MGYSMKRGSRWSAAAAAMMAISVPVHAADAEDPQQRIRELERQMQLMAEQLKAVQEQLSRSVPPAVSNAPAPAATSVGRGSPVVASFKNGLLLRDATGDWSLRLYARAQFDYRHFSPDRSAADTFSLRRARLGAIATFFEDFTLRIEGEYSEAATKLNDGYLDYTRFKPAMIRLGQFKTMHGLERSQGAMDLDFMERAMTESVIGSSFDRGIMLHGAPLNGVYYNLAYVNGTGQNIDESNALSDSKDWSLRVVGNLAQWAGWQNSVIHVGGFYLDGEQAAGAVVPKLRTEGRGAEFFKVADATTAVDRRVRGMETALAYGPVKFQGEYIRASFDDGTADRDMAAWYASVQWLLTGEHYADIYKNGAFAGIIPRNNFRHGNPGWGALEAGVRYTRFDASDFAAALMDSATATYTDGADAWTLGAKWIFSQNAQIQLNYVRTGFDKPILLHGGWDDHENAMNMRVQFDF